jgi:hypothetical protein
MRRIDWQRFATDRFFSRPAGPLHRSGLPPKMEPSLEANRLGDLAEEPIACWETMWIDFGGEG